MCHARATIATSLQLEQYSFLTSLASLALDLVLSFQAALSVGTNLSIQLISVLGLHNSYSHLRAEDLRAEDLRAEDLRAEDLRAEDNSGVRCTQILMGFGPGPTAATESHVGILRNNGR